MSEIKKMYKLANIKAINIAKNGSTYIPDNIQISGHLYPPFTAEKQIELIKWLAVKGDFDSSIDIAKNTYDYWTIYFQGARCTADGFEGSLAGLINNLWQDLTELERKQIKDILEECK